MLKNMQLGAIMVATDGSDSAKDAFYQALEFMTEDYHLYVAHISDSKELDLPLKYKNDYIWEDYKCECLSRLASTRYDLVFKEKNEEEDNVRNEILEIADFLKNKYLFIGYSGRKGKKMDPSLMGQTVRNSLYRTKIPLIVVKHLYKRSDKSANGFNFLVCVDGSYKSFKALEVAINLAGSENDRIYVVTASDILADQHSEIEVVKMKFEEIEAQHKNKKLTFIPLKSSSDLGKSIVEYVNFNEKIDFDFVVLGNNGMRAQMEKKEFLGRTAENILANAKANLITVPERF